MKQIFVSGGGAVEVLETPAPIRLPNSILVRNRYSLISAGTEGSAVSRRGGLMGVAEKVMASRSRMTQVWNIAHRQGIPAAWDAVSKKLADYVSLGYSCAGDIIECDGNTNGLVVGNRVACMGVEFAKHAEYVSIPRNLAVKIPDHVSYEEAAFGAVACIAMQGVRRANLSPGEYVGVIGLGLIGQVVVRILSGFGYPVIGIDRASDRVEKIGHTKDVLAWTTSECDSERRVLKETNGRGLDAVIVCAATPSDEPMGLAMDLCRKKGRVSIVGDVGLSLQRSKMYKKELDVKMSCSYGPGRYDNSYEIEGNDYPLGHVRWTEQRNLECFLDLLKTDRVSVKDLITQKFSVDDALQAYALVKNKEKPSFGVLVDYGEYKVEESINTAFRQVVVKDRIHPAALQPGVIRLGVIGAGGFVRSIHLPRLSKMQERIHVVGITSRGGASAATAAKRFGIPRVFSDYNDMIRRPDIDAVLIGTRHASHGKIAVDCLQHGKHIFVEKPLAITVEQCQEIVDLESKTGLTVRVGFNRRFSPFLIRMRECFTADEPRVFNCRVNVGSLSGHWSMSAGEGGRLIGEGVHFFDLCNWFMRASPTQIQTSRIGENAPENPNAVVSMTYSDGSVASVTYTTVGHEGLGKERYEAFGNGQSACCDDFHSLKLMGRKVGRRTRGKYDKGHNGILQEFVEAITGDVQDGADALAGLLATEIAVFATSNGKNQVNRTAA